MIFRLKRYENTFKRVCPSCVQGLHWLGRSLQEDRSERRRLAVKESSPEWVCPCYNKVGEIRTRDGGEGMWLGFLGIKFQAI